MIGTEVVAIVDSARTGILSIYHVSCEVLIDESMTPARCSACKKHRKLLLTMALRNQKDERAHPSSHTNYTYLSTPEKYERLHRLHTQCKISRLHIARLQKKLQELIEERGVYLDDSLDRDLKQILVDTTEEVHQCYQLNHFNIYFGNNREKPALCLINAQ